MSNRLTDADLEILATVGDEVEALAREVQASRKLIAALRTECAAADPRRGSTGRIWASAISRMIDEAGL